MSQRVRLFLVVTSALAAAACSQGQRTAPPPIDGASSSAGSDGSAAVSADSHFTAADVVPGTGGAFGAGGVTETGGGSGGASASGGTGATPDAGADMTGETGGRGGSDAAQDAEADMPSATGGTGGVRDAGADATVATGGSADSGMFDGPDGAVDGGAAAACVPGDTRSCAKAGLLGSCAGGVQRCDTGGVWLACSILPQAKDTCVPGHDDNCNGVPNEGCSCTEGALETCGPASNVGICVRGVSTCTAGKWGPCVGAKYATALDCTSSADNDCDGVPDNVPSMSCPCTVGSSFACDTHPQDGIGTCHAGSQTCIIPGDGSSTVLGPCTGSVGPAKELCDGKDENCDGQVNEAVTCTHVPVQAIAAGAGHTCALLTDGTGRCWGTNSSGQLGDMTKVDQATPVVVSVMDGPGRSTAITAGFIHTCALPQTGGTICWGDDTYGELGDGTSNDGVVQNLSGSVQAIVAGGNHTCAIVSGAVRCWGKGADGQLGFGTPYLNKTTPVPVYTPSPATALALGAGHTCALLQDETVNCWGDNSYGQVGVGTKILAEDSATAVAGISNAIAIAAGDYFSCAVLADNTARCWGYNGKGQLGDGTNDMQFSPTTVLGLNHVTSIAAGTSHTCALITDGTVRCWGDNSMGQVGDGTGINRLNSVAVVGLANVTAISAGGEHTCALLADATVWCWGGMPGQLGSGSEDPTTPSKVLLP